jgi:3-hydroxyisobutyrate dehydrogenase-like beta-hydroxyacid dehydrogenase
VEQGALVIFVGGDQAVYADQTPILDTLGHHIYMGHNGAGTTMKLVANTLLGLGMEALAEETTLGRKEDLDTRVMLDGCRRPASSQPRRKRKFENMIGGEYPATFALRLMFKDLGLILRLAESLSVTMPAEAAARPTEIIERARNDGREEDSPRKAMASR